MFVNIIIFVIILIILTLILKYSKGHKEGFFNFPDSKHNSYVSESATKFNPLTNTINLLNPQVPITQTSSNTFKNALSVVVANPTPSGYNLEAKSDFNLPSSSPSVFQEAQSCEKYGADCSAFDDPTFAANCGISFDTKAETASGKVKMGGLFVSAEDRQQQMARAESVLQTGSAPYDPIKVFQPTLGKSKPGTFALNKEQCTVVKERVECATKQTFGSPNCSQCYTSQTFSRIDPTTGRLPFNILFVGNGAITVAPANKGYCHAWTAEEQAKIGTGFNADTQKAVCNATPGQVFQGATGSIPTCGGCWCCEQVPFFIDGTTLDKSTPVTMAVQGNSEGTKFNIRVATSDGSMPWLAGYVSGQTPRGEFKVDLMTLIDKDNSTNKRPKINGTAVINSFKSIVMIPGTGGGSSTLSLSGMIPFTFLGTFDGDALNCDNGPVITQSASATFLESDPCFAKSNKPGSYSLECLQSRWLELGGTQQGTGYPVTAAAAATIQTGQGGVGLDIDTIVNSLAPKIASALSGIDASGAPLSLGDWNSLSMWATGTPISSPCDGPNKDNGPLSQECLSYLYLNQGATSHIGATYTLLPSQVASMTGTTGNATYCQPGTSLDPSTVDGLKKGQSLGGVNAVKAYYDQVNRLANDNTQKNAARSDAISQCYGVNLDATSTPSVASDIGQPNYTVLSGGYYDTSGPQTCFSGQTLEQAQQACTNMGANCAQISYSTDGTGSGCFKGNIAGSWTPSSQYVGYLKTTPSNTQNYNMISDGYLDTTGSQTCFSGQTLEQAQQACNNMGTNCAGFSFSTDGSGNGCLKSNVNGGWTGSSQYVGYLKV